jgi:dTDP-D-glucose 4,6-dehydratase
MEQVRAADAAATFSDLGWSPETDLDTGLRKTFEWYRQVAADQDAASSGSR